MADIIVKGANGTEQRWPLPEEMTYGEFRMLKALAGVEPAGFSSAIEQADAATIMVVAIISAQRAGVELTMDDLDRLPFGAVTIEDDEDRPTVEAAPAADALPATTPDNGGNPS